LLFGVARDLSWWQNLVEIVTRAAFGFVTVLEMLMVFGLVTETSTIKCMLLGQLEGHCISYDRRSQLRPPSADVLQTIAIFDCVVLTWSSLPGEIEALGLHDEFCFIPNLLLCHWYPWMS
jgi:hypothetical protein